MRGLTAMKITKVAPMSTVQATEDTTFPSAMPESRAARRLGLGASERNEHRTTLKTESKA